ncbi:S-adenosyl-L-methionine-dependent methyltransferase [Halteromyces radiatus]|uniref:S-adenosyl-L-methionine-dependent methyltransferase n=1 Tax=Halteromyces radiatus TaxID=101107 RepID=UPI00221F103D|nr:S-adenosyl-L-methionine-dependent methyltransferase [Halteromyces radiatus]KAI8088717.1 S-adenosyl-L-methionine-dependent methyltransferase [Halteromyces radiatus]
MVSSSPEIVYDNDDIVFQYKSGRKLVDDESVAYILPSDATEVKRLELNHNLWKMILDGLYKSSVHESLVEGITILDVGCGPGFWIRDMAILYPNSKFIGIDMADVFITKDLPPNVEFQIINAAMGLPFQDESFDFVFQRFLVMGFPTDTYKQSIKEMKRVLKPNGAIEILELVNHYTNPSPALTKISGWRMDSFIGDKISSFLKDASFQQIRDINYNVPIGEWGGEPGKLYLAIQRLALPAVGIMVIQLTSVTEEEYQETLKEAFSAANQFQSSTRFRLVYAKK